METIAPRMDAIDLNSKQTERWWQPRQPVDADGLVLHNFGIDERMPPSVIRHGGRGCPWLLIQFHGPALAVLADGSTRDVGGQVLLWPPGTGHRYGHPGRTWRHSWLNLDGPVAERIIRAHRVPVGTPIPAAYPGLLRRWLAQMADELMQWERPDAGMLHRLFDLLAYELGRTSPPPRSRVPACVQTAKAHIDGHIAESLRLDRLARLGGVEAAYLCRAFKTWIGLPPLAYQRRERLQRAAHLLLDPELGVAAAAAAVGYADPLHFSRMFKAWSGASPMAWRRSEWRRADAGS